ERGLGLYKAGAGLLLATPDRAGKPLEGHMLEQPKNHLLGFLRARPRAIGEAFRSNPRHSARRRARILWHAGSQTHTSKARLIDTGRMGAAVSTTTPPPDAARICLRLVGSTPTPWIEGDVLGIEPSEGVYRVRIRFREPCPNVLLKTAVLGPVTAVEEHTPEHEQIS